MNFKLPVLKKLKIKQLSVILLAGALLLALSNLAAVDTKSKKTQQISEKSSSVESENTEKRLAEIIGRVKGVSNVSVFITYENNGVHKTADNLKETTSIKDGGTDVSREKTKVMKKQSASEEPFVSEETLPQVRGVLIVANGVGSPAVNAEITDAVSAVLGVAVHKVKILQSD